MTTPNIDKNTYMTDSRFKVFRDKGISYDTFSFDQNYYMNQLSKSSVMDLYNKGKAMYEKYTALYNQSNNLFIQLKSKQAKNKVRYNELLQSYANKNNTGEVTSAQKSSAARESGYTVELNNSVNSAELASSICMDGRRMAVNMQRRGLAQSVFESVET